MIIFKQRSNKKIIILICIILIVPSISFARYYEKIENIKGKATIAEPIFIVKNNQNTIIQTIDKESVIEEYLFTIKNYKVEENGLNKRYSEVDIEYSIEIFDEKENFPVEYKLYEANNQEELLNGNKITNKIKILANQPYEKTYKLVVNWKEKSESLDDSNNIKIIVNATQLK